MGEARPARGGLVRAFNVGRKGLGCGRHGKIRRWMGSQTEWWEVGAGVGVVGEVSSAAAWGGGGRGIIRRWGGRGGGGGGGGQNPGGGGGGGGEFGEGGGGWGGGRESGRRRQWAGWG